MARAHLTPELGSILKTERVKNNIKATMIASAIGKSPAFITKLENGKLQTIDDSELYTIIKIISNDNEPDALLNNIYESLEISYTRDEIAHQLWLNNFDTTRRLIPISNELVDFINSELNKYNIKREYLLFRINSNEALSSEEISDESLPVNQWYNHADDRHLNQHIKISLNNITLNGILDRTITSSSYIVLQSIVFYLLKIKQCGEDTEISNSQYDNLFQQTIDILNKYKFYNILEKRKLQNNTGIETDTIDSEYEILNKKLIQSIINNIKFASLCNIDDTNIRLSHLSNNMNWDLGFVMKIVSYEYYDFLKNTPVDVRKQYLRELEELNERYRIISRQERNIEQY